MLKVISSGQWCINPIFNNEISTIYHTNSPSHRCADLAKLSKICKKTNTHLFLNKFYDVPPRTRVYAISPLFSRLVYLCKSDASDFDTVDVNTFYFQEILSQMHDCNQRLLASPPPSPWPRTLELETFYNVATPNKKPTHQTTSL